MFLQSNDSKGAEICRKIRESTLLSLFMKAKNKQKDLHYDNLFDSI